MNDGCQVQDPNALSSVTQKGRAIAQLVIFGRSMSGVVMKMGDENENKIVVSE